jgi:hypothetical protein
MKAFFWMSDVSSVETYSNSPSDSDDGSNVSKGHILLERLRQVEEEFVSFCEAFICMSPESWMANI